jgi:tetratricopeptide (TPR) repeat protein
MVPARLSSLLLLCLVLLGPLPARASEPLDFRILQKLVKEGADQTALEQGEAYLKAYPKSPHRAQVAAWVGEFLYEGGQMESALPYLDEGLKGLPSSKHGRLPLLKARALLGLHRPEAAEAALRGYRPAGEKDRSEALRVEAEAASAGSRPAEAVKALKAIPEKQFSDADRLHLGLALASSGQDEKAAAVLSPLVSNGVLSGQALRKARLTLASCLYRTQRYDRALDVLSPMTGSTEPDREAGLLKAWVLHAQKKDAQAYDLVRKVVPLQGWKSAAALEPVLQAAAEHDTGALLSRSAALLKTFPSGPAAGRARVLSAQALQERGDVAGALLVMQAALPDLEASPDRIRTALRGADLAWREMHDPEKAGKWLAVAAKAAETQEEKARVAFSKARFEWETGHATDAIKTLADIVRGYKGTAPIPDAYLLLGRILVAQGEREKGRQALKVVVDAFPDSPDYAEAALDMAESLAAEGRDTDLAGPLADLEGIALSAAQGSRKNYLSGRLALASGKWDLARALFAESARQAAGPEMQDSATFASALADIGAGRIGDALKEGSAVLSPDLNLAVKFRAAAALAAGDGTSDAESILEKLSRQEGPAGALALWDLADLQIKAKAEDKGMATLRELASWSRSEPLSVLAQRRIEMILLTRKGATAALMAVPAFKEAEPVALGEMDALLRAARLKAHAGETAGAEKAYRTYLQRMPGGPGAPEAAGYLAGLSMKRSDYAAARRLLESAPESPERDYMLGEACFNLRDMSAAQSAFEAALAKPDTLKAGEATRARLLAGTAARIQGKTAQAVQHLSAYVSGAPATASDKTDLFNASLWLQKRGQYDAALAGLDKLRKAFRDAEIGFNYGYTLELAGRKEDALKAYLQVAYASANPQWALTARYRAAELMVALGRTADAIALYKELVSRTEGTVQGDFAGKRLEELQKEAPPAVKDKNSSPEGGQDATSATAHREPEPATHPSAH